MKMLRLAILCQVSLLACVHSPETAELKAEWKGFPPSFSADQDLLVVRPGEEQRLKAQIEKSDDRIILVLIEALFGIVLAKAELVKGSPPRLLYLAPQVAKQKLPFEAIGESIQKVFSGSSFRRGDEGKYQLDEGIYRYTFDQFAGPAACRYPRVISLRFADERYRVRVETLSFSCKPPRGS